jgi:hypothetical protein
MYHGTLKSTVMTQHSMKKGIQLFDDAGISPLLKEVQELHNLRALAPKNGNKMMHIEEKRALETRPSKTKSVQREENKENTQTRKTQAQSNGFYYPVLSMLKKAGTWQQLTSRGPSCKPTWMS